MGSLHKDKQQPEMPQRESLYFDCPYGRFLYVSSPTVQEYGYEGEITRPNGQVVLSVYLDTDSPGSLEMRTGYARMEKILLDTRIDCEAKKTVAAFFCGREAYTACAYTVEELTEKMQIWWLAVLRNGDTQFGFHTKGIAADEILLTLHENGTKTLSYIDYQNQKHEDII